MSQTREIRSQKGKHIFKKKKKKTVWVERNVQGGRGETGRNTKTGVGNIEMQRVVESQQRTPDAS